jgi:GTPase SAR1 family protein
MNFELRSNTSIEINERQAKVQLPIVWKTQKKLFQAMHQATTNEMRRTKLTVNKNQNHPLLNYLLKNTPSKLKNNFMLLETKT